MNYTFINIRTRDKHRSQIIAERDAENDRLEKLSQETNYTKPRKPNHDSEVCYKSNTPSNDDGDGADDDDDEEGNISFFSETVNLKSKEAGVYTPIDIYDKGRLMHKNVDKSDLF